ncbi:putative acetyltransferase [compost metagenome]
MGRYIGMRAQGRLVAMAGERMHPAGHVEISAVCVDDDWRGKGLAGRLMQRLQRDILQRGESPFLHVLSDNRNAIALYERLGFALRQTFSLSLIGLAEPAANPA